MILTLYIVCSLFLIVAYTGLIIFIFDKWIPDTPIDDRTSSGLPASFSFIIPARNEENSIGHCLHSILNNESGNFNPPQIIVVDDHSEDETANIVRKDFHEQVLLLSLEEHLDKNEINSYKKEAVQLGISHATGDYIIQLDADCTIGPHYLKGLSDFISIHQPDMIAGPVRTRADHSLLSIFQALDMAAMMAFTKAGIDSKLWYIANGANLAYKKDWAFELEKELASGDDVHRIQKAARLTNLNIRFAALRELIVETQSLGSWGELYHQRLRWATKNKYVKETPMILAMLLVFLNSVWWPVHLAAFVIWGTPAIIVFAIHLATRLAVDYILLEECARFFSLQRYLKYFIPVWIMETFYIAWIGLLSLFVKKYNWKGRYVQ